MQSPRQALDRRHDHAERRIFRQVSIDVEEGASGPEGSTLLLRRLMTHFDRVGTGEGYTGCIVLACAREHRFAILAENFACLLYTSDAADE